MNLPRWKLLLEMAEVTELMDTHKGVTKLTSVDSLVESVCQPLSQVVERWVFEEFLVATRVLA